MGYDKYHLLACLLACLLAWLLEWLIYWLIHSFIHSFMHTLWCVYHHQSGKVCCFKRSTGVRNKVTKTVSEKQLFFVLFLTISIILFFNNSNTQCVCVCVCERARASMYVCVSSVCVCVCVYYVAYLIIIIFIYFFYSGVLLNCFIWFKYKFIRDKIKIQSIVCSSKSFLLIQLGKEKEKTQMYGWRTS